MLLKRLILLTTLCFFISLGSALAEDYSIKIIRFAHVVSENTPKHQGALKLKEYIEEKSDGQIKVQVYPNSSLYGDKDEVENLIANNVQFICPDMSKLTRYDGRYDVPSMPFLFEDDQAVFDFWDKGKGQELLKGLEREGIIGLRCWPNGFKNITNNKLPIKKPGDIKGLKIRTQSGEVLSSIYETLDASPMSIAFGELFTALQQGVVDGQSNTFSNIYTKKFDEVQKYMSVTQHNRVDYLLLTNKRFMDSLNEKTRKLVMEAIDVATEKERELSIELNNQAYKKLKERGQMEIYELTKEDRKAFREALAPVYEKYTPVIGEDVLEDAMSR